jgi:hypothetical protein
MKKLYSGFDLTSPSTSVSMTINGPAPIILAMFMNTAIDQRVEHYLKAEGRWSEAERRIAELGRAALERGVAPPAYKGERPAGHDGSGLALLGVTGDQLVAPEVYERIKSQTLQAVRGTVQADILKEDQAQNTCIFSTEFALRMMGDVQQYFIDHRVRNFYSVSISGYHIAEAGANPISQLAFTLANGFTIVEYYLARGMDDRRLRAQPVVSSSRNGMDPEYAVIGRVARRIWARAMRERYGARSAARCSSTTCRRPAAACTRRRSSSTTSAPRCRRSTRSSTTATACTPTPTTRRSPRRPRSRAPRRGDPAHHQPRAGPAMTENPWQGVVRHRRADRPRRGGGATEFDAIVRARRRAGRDGDDVPARQDPGGVAVLRAQEARRQPAASSASTPSCRRNTPAKPRPPSN